MNFFRYCGHLVFTWKLLLFYHNYLWFLKLEKPKVLRLITCLHWVLIEDCIFWIGSIDTMLNHIMISSLLSLESCKLYYIVTSSTCILPKVNRLLFINVPIICGRRAICDNHVIYETSLNYDWRAGLYFTLFYTANPEKQINF